MTTDAKPKPKRMLSRAASIGWAVWQQAAAVFAAFGLAAMLGQFWHIGWHGFIETVVGIWDATIRPSMEWVFHVVVTVPLSWLGVRFEVPLWVRDYLSVGLVLAISASRVGVTSTGRVVAVRTRFWRRDFWKLNEKAPWLTTNDGRESLGRRSFYIAMNIFLALWRWPAFALVLAWPVLIAVMVSLVGHIGVILQGIRNAGTDDGFVPMKGDPGTIRLATWWNKDDGRRFLGAAWSFAFTLSPFLYIAILLAINTWVMPHIS